MTSAELSALIYEVAKHLNSMSEQTWIRDQNYDTCLSSGSLRLHFREVWNDKGKVHVSGSCANSLSSFAHGYGKPDFPGANISTSKGAQGIAKDILRRVIPGTIDIVRAAEDQRDSYRAHYEDRAQRLRGFAQIGGWRTENEEVSGLERMSFPKRVIIRTSKDMKLDPETGKDLTPNNTSGDLTVYEGTCKQHRVDMKLSLNEDQARKVLELLATL